MRTTRIVPLLAIAALSATPTARAQTSESSVRAGAPISDSRHELSTQLGYQIGLGGPDGSPSGVKWTADYNFRFHRHAWFDLQLGNVFGVGAADGVCANGGTCYRGGWEFTAAAGVRFRWKVEKPALFVDIPVLVGIDALYLRGCNDDGAALPVVRSGGRLTWFPTPRVGLHAGVTAAVGPAIHSANTCQIAATGNGGSSTSIYAVIDFMFGAAFLL